MTTTPTKAENPRRATVLYSDQSMNEWLRSVCASSERFSIREYFDGKNWMVDYEIAAVEALLNERIAA